MFQDLTNDGKKLIAQIYKFYLEKRESGISKSQSSMMGNGKDLHDNLDSNLSQEDFDDTIRELSRADYIHALYGSDVPILIELNTSTIIDMENRFKDGIKSVWKFISTFI